MKTDTQVSTEVEQQPIVPAKKYSYSLDEQMYDGEYDSPEEALEAAKKDWPEKNEYWIGEIEPAATPDELFSAEDWLDHVACQEEYSGDWCDAWHDDAAASRPHHEDLEEQVKPILRAWLKKHGLMPTFYTVINSKHFPAEGGNR